VYVCARIHRPVCALCILRGAVVLTGDKDSGGECVTAGGGYSGRRSGKWCFEVEGVLGKGKAFAGMAGTDFRGNTLGEHPASWAVYIDGDTYHRFAQVTVPSYTVRRAVPSIALRAGLALAK
jgi:hypothetical protein